MTGLHARVSDQKIVETTKPDGSPFTSYTTWAVLGESDERLGTLQTVRPTMGLMRLPDDGRRHAWIGDGTGPGQHLGVFADQGLALQAIRATGRVRSGRLEP